MKQMLPHGENPVEDGVETSDGKAITRFNARKHGIFATALTPEDSEELNAIEENLAADLRPVGRVEEILVETLAMTYLRMQRCARAEAEYYVRTWKKPNKREDEDAWEELKRKRACKAWAVPFQDEQFRYAAELIGLYNARLTSQFMKTLHEIERRQRLRKGENVPPPSVADINIQSDAETARALLNRPSGLAQEQSQVIEAQRGGSEKTI